MPPPRPPKARSPAPTRRKVAPARPPQAGALTALVLQGGGALGAYQAGAYQALAEQGRAPDWVAGISIGAINAAVIAGNAPEHRVERLRTFWERVSSSIPAWPLAGEDAALRPVVNDWAAAWGALFGLPGFFRPRAAALTPLHGHADGPVTSFYLTDPLRATLNELVDFDRIHDGAVRLSVGAVDVEQGNFVYFDSRSQRLKPEHVMASGALPPGFPAVTVDGRPYWDGGLVSNTPLAYVVDEMQHGAATIFQIDLFSARGRVPQTLAEAAEREKDIRYSSRTRAVTDMLRARHEQDQRLRALAALL
ncbi:MAG: patatin-like phospholipase family protein, partial [Betaproteobacteria bacterium]|nr:patatin-like phospholipase family protein [Betaproteobacteria bacterium]